MQVEAPFQEIVSHLNRSSSEASQNWHAYWKQRDQVFENWCVNSIDSVAKKITTPQNRLIAIQRILDTFIPEEEHQSTRKNNFVNRSTSTPLLNKLYTGGNNSSPQLKRREDWKFHNISNSHVGIIKHVYAILSVYLTQKDQVDKLALKTEKKIWEYDTKFNVARKNLEDIQYISEDRGLGNRQKSYRIINSSINEPQSVIKSDVEQNLNVQQQDLFETQTKLKQALSSISAWLDQLSYPGPKFKLAETPRFDHPPFNKKPLEPQPIINVTQNNLIVLNSNLSGLTTPFRWTVPKGKEIDSFVFRGKVSFTCFVVKLASYQKTQALGSQQRQNQQEQSQIMLPEFVETIRVKIAHIKNVKYITELQFVSKNRQMVSSVKVGATLGDWTEFHLDLNEKIVGIFGETIHSLGDEPLKQFGFVIERTDISYWQ